MLALQSACHFKEHPAAFVKKEILAYEDLLRNYSMKGKIIIICT